MGRYASENGTTAAVRKYSSDHGEKLKKESTIRGFKNAYEKELRVQKQALKNGEDVILPIKSLYQQRNLVGHFFLAVT